MPFKAPRAMPINTLKGTWTRLLETPRLQRSSHVLSVLSNTLCIFGGEVQPRQPIDSKTDMLSLHHDSTPPTLTTKSSDNAPTPRVGTASASLNGKMYLFSGRGGTDMSPLSEAGVLWEFDAASSSWAKLSPADSSRPVPPPRSYHCSTSDGDSSLFVHAGCPKDGRLSDLWKFDVTERVWTQLADAPAPQRGGASIAYANGKLYRMNGFDGNTEQGGSIDVFDISANEWSTETFKADGNDGPEARSVCVLLPVRLAQKDKLLTLFGERDPSALGHAGAGKMLSDVWIYDISEKWWTQLHPESTEGIPDPRGWFDADVVKNESGNDSVVIHGGLGENNERLSDVWLLSF